MNYPKFAYLPEENDLCHNDNYSDSLLGKQSEYCFADHKADWYDGISVFGIKTTLQVN